jgi:hypothetical protein
VLLQQLNFKITVTKPSGDGGVDEFGEYQQGAVSLKSLSKPSARKSMQLAAPLKKRAKTRPSSGPIFSMYFASTLDAETPRDFGEVWTQAFAHARYARRELRLGKHVDVTATARATARQASAFRLKPKATSSESRIPNPESRIPNP